MCDTMVTTTIQVERDTRELLSYLKPAFEANTFDEVIKALVKKKMKGQYGKYAKKGLSTKKLMKDLRDKNDRF